MYLNFNQNQGKVYRFCKKSETANWTKQDVTAKWIKQDITMIGLRKDEIYVKTYPIITVLD